MPRSPKNDDKSLKYFEKASRYKYAYYTRVTSEKNIYLDQTLGINWVRKITDMYINRNQKLN